MKNIFALIVLSFVFYSCAIKKPYTEQIKEDYGLAEEEKMRKVQFFTSSTIVLDQVAESSSETTTDESGTLVSSLSSESESLIIQTGTRCIFEGYGPNGEIRVKFEEGDQKFLKFRSKGGQPRGRFYLHADWKASGGPKVKYGGKEYKIDMMRTTKSPKQMYLKVSIKRNERNKRKTRVVKGMKV